MKRKSEKLHLNYLLKTTSYILLFLFQNLPLLSRAFNIAVSFVILFCCAASSFLTTSLITSANCYFIHICLLLPGFFSYCDRCRIGKESVQGIIFRKYCNSTLNRTGSLLSYISVWRIPFWFDCLRVVQYKQSPQYAKDFEISANCYFCLNFNCRLEIVLVPRITATFSDLRTSYVLRRH